MAIILSGDIGGTKTLLRLTDTTTKTVVAETRYDSRVHATFDVVIRDFLADRTDVRAACFAVAGPVLDRRASVTNLTWDISERALSETFAIPAVVLVNDFHAVAMGVPLLTGSDLVVLNDAPRVSDAPIAIIGAGTGLGEAILLPEPSSSWRVVASEGGHADFAPTNEEQVELLRFLLREYDHVSYERVVSGMGITNIYRFLLAADGLAVANHLDDVPAHVAGLAAAGDARASHALDLFVAIYGSEAANLGLKVLARGGVFLAGGIAPKHVERFASGVFMSSFLAKGRFEELMRSMPVYLITNTTVGLIGATDTASRMAVAM